MFWWPEVKHQHLLFNCWVVHALLALGICYAIVDNYVLLFLACYGVPRKYFVVFRIIDISDMRSNDDWNDPNLFVCIILILWGLFCFFFTRFCALIREKSYGVPHFSHMLTYSDLCRPNRRRCEHNIFCAVRWGQCSACVRHFSEIGAPSNTNLNTNTNALLTSWTCHRARWCDCEFIWLLSVHVILENQVEV